MSLWHRLSTRSRVAISLALFFLLTSWLLLGLLAYALKYHRRQNPPMDFANSQMNSPPPGWRERMWRRFLDPGAPPTGRQSRGDGAETTRSRGLGGGSGAGMAGSTDPNHQALREVANALIILYSQHQVGLQIVRQEFAAACPHIPPTTPFRLYEQQRLESRLVIELFDNDDSESPLLARRLRAETVKTAAMPYADFEEFLFAALGCLYDRDPVTALTWTEKAEAAWPNRGGLGYGDLWLTMLTAHAAAGEDELFLDMVGRFRYTYPNWMFVETYMPDLDRLTRLYPQAPLLHVLRGFCYRLINHDAAAQRAYREALAGASLSGEARGFVEEQLFLIEARAER